MAVTLSVGDIAIVEYNADFNTFKFVALTELDEGDVIFFTDRGWDANLNAFGTSGTDTTITYTVPAGGIPIGTVIDSSSVDFGGGVFNLSTGGDQIFVYQTTDDVASSAPTFIGGFHGDGEFDPLSTTIGTSSTDSHLPTGLTDGTNVFTPTEVDNQYYDGPTDPAGKADWLARLANEANWTTDATFDTGDPPAFFNVICFCAGSLIATPGGERAVEALAIGDRVLTTDGQTATVKWVGRQTVAPRFAPAERLMPVRFAAGSLDKGVPHSDLTVTADHAMLVDGVLCNAGALVNGTTITRVPLAEMGEHFTVYHIETDAHEIILANGAPTETFIDNVSRRVFDNYTEFEALYGDVPEMEELPLPRAMSARQVPGVIRDRLAGRKTA